MIEGGPLALVLLAALGAFLVEAARKLSLVDTLAELRGTLDRSRRLVRRAGVSDHWKERALLAYARRTLGAVTRLISTLVLLVGNVIGAAVLFGFAVDGFMRAVFAPAGMVALTVFAVLHLLLRRRLAHD